jgi:hydrogenase nickel incorporation protein HypA/HybF
VHELQVTERILEVALDHASRNAVARIVAIHLRIGRLTDLEDHWIQHYFDYLSRGTLAENARLEIERSPIVMDCDACACSFEIGRDALRDVQCPECGESRCRLVAGREYFVKTMEVV